MTGSAALFETGAETVTNVNSTMLGTSTRASRTMPALHVRFIVVLLGIMLRGLTIGREWNTKRLESKEKRPRVEARGFLATASTVEECNR
jgi:hypothetical protein